MYTWRILCGDDDDEKKPSSSCINLLYRRPFHSEKHKIMTRVLVIGGTQFIGRNLMKRLLRSDKEFDVTVLNRGKTPWPFEKDCCKRLRCDRLNDRKRFREAIESEKDFDVVVDFVAFSVENVRDVIVSTKRTCHYIFISTDSVHMACLPPKDARRALREEDAVLGAKLPKKLRKIRGSYQIQYGLSKLQAEQYLRDEAKDRYTALRYGLRRFLFLFENNIQQHTQIS